MRPVTRSETAALATVAVCACVLVMTGLAYLIDARTLAGTTV